MNKNNKNDKLDILSKILLVIIVLSFVFSAVALGRSCSVNTAAADTYEPPYLSDSDYSLNLTYVIPDTYEFDDISFDVYYAYNSIDIDKLYVWVGTNIDIYFARSDWEISISIVPDPDGTNGGTSMIIYATDIDNFSDYIFDGTYTNCINGYPVFSVHDILNTLFALGCSVNVGSTMTVYQNYNDAQFVREGLYTVSYEPVEPEPAFIEDPVNQFNLFNGATVTYTIIDTTVSVDNIFYTVTVPVQVSFDSSFISLDNLVDILPPSILTLNFNSLQSPIDNVMYHYVEDFYITLSDSRRVDLRSFTITGFGSSVPISFTAPAIIFSPISGTLSSNGLISLNEYVISYYNLTISDISFGRSFYSLENLTYYRPYRDYLASFKLVYGDLFEQGYTVGYDRAISDQNINIQSIEDEAFERGRIRGAAEANNYTFFGLLSAVVDAPIQAVTGLLNFEFLGINLFAFFTGLLTVALILFIVKKIMGG